MKNLILAVTLLVTTLSFAQERRMKQDLTPEQKTEIRVKQMTLDLDLNESQQKEIKNLMLNKAKEREAKREAFLAKKATGEKPSKEERYNTRITRLDNQIEWRNELEKILNEKQMEKWEKINAERKDKIQTHRRKMK
jgi:Spy/CpxP family protein refolding chaperone